MSAPDTNIERQKTRHITMLRGIWIGLLIAAGVAFVLIVSDDDDQATAPASAVEQTG
ncbi:hypothetical protein [uncultured Roseobacter sp.]|uniref:hypothetical protein n=1 Tax=uncultured Roseobacter sp. TaxID=114847 RepID=UPI00260EC72B|nr:hypothetical protein [uncultured Roseobacter sp.]